MSASIRGLPSLRLARRAALMLGLVCLAAAPAHAEPYRLDIATGGVTGIYYQFGAAICRLLRDHPPAHAITCRTEGSAGSVANLLSLDQDEVPLALAQADSMHDAVTGTGSFADRAPDRGLRALFSPVTETFLVLTRANDEMTQIVDLMGRRVNVGPPASGTEATFHQLMAARGWSDADFAALSNIRPSQQTAALCGGRVDAIAFVAANPVPAMQEATFACATHLLPLDQQFIRTMIERHRYYVPAIVPGGLYPNNPQPTPTIGVRGVVAATVATPDELVYEITRTVFENVAELRTLHLAFADVVAREMVEQCMFAPIHRGAARYYREAGIKLPPSCLPGS